jgi:hypothetical protein
MGPTISKELPSGAGLARLAGPGWLDAVGRQWTEQQGGAIVGRTVAALVRDLPADASPDAVAAAMAHALAVVVAARAGDADD